MKTNRNSVIKLAKIIRAMGHPIRIEILRLLSTPENKTLSVKQIHQSLGLTQPEASKHLSLLKSQSVLICEKKDGHSFYRINGEKSFVRCIIDYLEK